MQFFGLINFGCISGVIAVKNFNEIKNEFIGLNNFYETKDVGKKTEIFKENFTEKKLIDSGHFNDAIGCFFYE